MLNSLSDIGYMPQSWHSYSNVKEQDEVSLLLTAFDAGVLPGDTGYGCDAIVKSIQKQGMQPVIPLLNNRIAPRHCDWSVYKARHLIEYFFREKSITGECFHDLKNSP